MSMSACKSYAVAFLLANSGWVFAQQVIESGAPLAAVSDDSDDGSSRFELHFEALKQIQAFDVAYSVLTTETLDGKVSIQEMKARHIEDPDIGFGLLAVKSRTSTASEQSNSKSASASAEGNWSYLYRKMSEGKFTSHDVSDPVSAKSYGFVRPELQRSFAALARAYSWNHLGVGGLGGNAALDDSVLEKIRLSYQLGSPTRRMISRDEQQVTYLNTPKPKDPTQSLTRVRHRFNLQSGMIEQYVVQRQSENEWITLKRRDLYWDLVDGVYVPVLAESRDNRLQAPSGDTGKEVYLLSEGQYEFNWYRVGSKSSYATECALDLDNIAILDRLIAGEPISSFEK